MRIFCQRVVRAHSPYNSQDTHIDNTRLARRNHSGGTILKVQSRDSAVTARACACVWWRTLRNSAVGPNGKTRNVARRKYATWTRGTEMRSRDPVVWTDGVMAGNRNYLFHANSICKFDSRARTSDRVGPPQDDFTFRTSLCENNITEKCTHRRARVCMMVGRPAVHCHNQRRVDRNCD